jgi:hypothetical protein
MVPTVETIPSNRSQHGKEHGFSPTPPAMVRRRTELSPVLPITWQYAVGTPSSFEQALDDVVRKLDEMETKPAMSELKITLKPKTRRGTGPLDSPDADEAQPEVLQSKEALLTLAEQKQSVVGPRQKSKAMTTDTSSSSFANHRLQRAAAMRRQRIAAVDGAKRSKPLEDTVPLTPSDVVPSYPPPASGSQLNEKSPPGKNTAKTAASLSVEDVSVDHYDRDINDRDVLKGLKLAVSVACDEKLDAWIRGKTGLRLRRFLADLKTFEKLDMEDQFSASGTTKKPVNDKVDVKETETAADTTENSAKTTDKGSVVHRKVESVEAAQPEGSKGKPRSSAGIRRDGNEVKEPENKRTSAGARRPEPEPSDQKTGKHRAEKRKAQVEKGEEKEQRHKHLLRAEA